MSSPAAERFAEALREANEAFNAGDYERALAGLAPDVEWHFGAWVFDGGVLQGRDAVIDHYRQLGDSGSWTVEILDVEEIGPGRFLTHNRGHWVGRTTAIAGERESFQLWEIGPNGTKRLREFATRDEALEAL